MKRRIFSIILSLAVLVCSISTIIPAARGADAASGLCGDGLTWTLDASGTLTISGSGDMYDYRTYMSPAGEEAAPWDAAAVLRIVLEPGVTGIGTGAFYACESATELVIPDTVVRIGKLALPSSSGLTELFLPASVTEMGESVFTYYGPRPQVRVDEANPSLSNDENGALFDKEKTVLFSFPTAYAGAYRVPETVQIIGLYAFARCDNLTGVTLPRALRSIRAHAFYQCRALTYALLPEGLTDIGAFAFGGCSSLTGLEIPASVSVIGRCAFWSCTGLTSVTVPANVTSVEVGTFKECKSLREVQLPEGLTAIKGSAFLESGLTSIRLPDSLRTIESGAFYGCKQLTAITIPDSVEKLGYHAFLGCTRLAEVTLPAQLPALSPGTFSGCSSLKELQIPASVQQIGDYCFEDSGVLLDPDGWTDGVRYLGDCLISVDPAYSGALQVREGTRLLANGAFSGCEELTEVRLPEGLQAIPKDAFSGCKALTRVSVPESVSSLGYSAFYGCEALETLELPQVELVYAGYGEYDDNVSRGFFHGSGIYLNESNWADGVLYVGDILVCAKPSLSGAYSVREGTRIIARRAFSGCTALTQLTIPDSVTQIGAGAFEKCSGLQQIRLPSGITELEEHLFSNCERLASLKIPDGVTTIGWSAFDGCTALAEVAIPDSVTSILSGFESTALWSDPARWDGDALYLSNHLIRVKETFSGRYVVRPGTRSIATNAFLRCTAMTAVDIPDSVAGIGTGAFAGSALTEVSLPEGLQSLPLNCFSGCSALREIRIPASLRSIGDGAFMGCISLRGVYFAGDAPRLEINENSAPNDDVFRTNYYYAVAPDNIFGLTLYYREGAAGWTSPSWLGYPTALWEETHRHVYDASVTPPTCTTQGYTTHTCICGDSYRDGYTAAMGHSYANGICIRCGAAEPGTRPCDGGAGCPGRQFGDMPPAANWAHEGIDFAVSRGLFAGVSETRFDPAGSMTRAMVVSVLYRLDGRQKPQTAAPFTDVRPGQWYAEAVAWAAENNIVAGVGNGKFDPNGKVTREQLAAILYRYARWKGYSVDARADLSRYPDAEKVGAGFAFLGKRAGIGQRKHGGRRDVSSAAGQRHPRSGCIDSHALCPEYSEVSLSHKIGPGDFKPMPPGPIVISDVI